MCPINLRSTVDLGKVHLLANQTSSWSIANIPANPQATAARVLFNFHNVLSPIPTVDSMSSSMVMLIPLRGHTRIRPRIRGVHLR